MHSAQELRSSSFEVSLDGRPASLADLFPGFGEQDRLGLVMRRPHGAVGASALITATITAFYDLQRARGPDFYVYPDYYLLHVGRPLGDHGRLDVWPPHKEVVVRDDPEAILEAVNDRAITRLVVEDVRAPSSGEHAGFSEEALVSARARVRSCLAYSASGRVRSADVRIAGNPITEGYVQAILDPVTRIAKLREPGAGEAAVALADAVATRAGEVEQDVRDGIRTRRSRLIEDGVPVETYRRIALDEALALLGG